VERIPVQQCHLECYKHVAVFVVCVSRDHSITTDPYCALRVISIPNNCLCIVVTNNTAEMLTPFDGDVHLEN
jgi:hypothetical protein